MKSRALPFALAAAVALIALLALWFAWRSRPTPAPASLPPAASQAAAAPAITPEPPVATLSTPAASSAPSVPRPAPVAAVPQNPLLPAASTDRAQMMVELEKVHRMIDSYHTLMGQNPVGTNAEIMKAIMGGNPHQAMLGPPPGQSLNAKGELVDPWGTPYFFHQLSGDHMAIHSAGPDKIMGTADDLIIP